MDGLPQELTPRAPPFPSETSLRSQWGHSRGSCHCLASHQAVGERGFANFVKDGISAGLGVPQRPHLGRCAGSGRRPCLGQHGANTSKVLVKKGGV